MKIASLLPSTTEIVCALGLEDSLVGITHECDFPVSITGKPALTASRISHETMTSLEIDHAVRSQLDGHGSIYDLDEKLLRDLDPDLIPDTGAVRRLRCFLQDRAKSRACLRGGRDSGLTGTEYDRRHFRQCHYGR